MVRPLRAIAFRADYARPSEPRSNLGTHRFPIPSPWNNLAKDSTFDPSIEWWSRSFMRPLDHHSEISAAAPPTRAAYTPRPSPLRNLDPLTSRARAVRP